MEKLATEWHAQHLLPVLDILRVLAQHPHAAEHFFSGVSLVFRKPNLIVDKLVAAHLRPEAAFANQLMVLRLLANLFRYSHSRTKTASLLADSNLNLISALDGLASSTNKNIQTALATLLLNFIVLLSQDSSLESREQNEQRLSAVLLKMLDVDQNDDALFRIFVGLGTAALKSAEIKKEVKASLTPEKVEKIGSTAGITEKSKSSLDELRKVLDASNV